MTCAGCGHENRSGAKFCEECAAPLPRVCAGCGSALRPTAKFCDECGAPASGARSEAKASGDPRTPPTPIGDTRKIVTIVFADLVGSTALHERLDPESARRFMESYYDAMRGAVESHGGTVTQLLGDGVKAVFGIPRVTEDDAIRAVHAAAAMQEAFRGLAEQQRGAVGKTGLRVAVNTGEVVARDETEIIGDPVNVAARLQEQGHDGDVVVGESTHRLVSTLVTLELLGSFALKGRSEAVKAYRVVSLERPAGAATAPFVGRDEELTRLAAVYDTAVEKPAAGLAVLLGSPGLGKSRLIDEFARRHADAATVVQASCDAAGGATFAPLAEALRELLGIESGASAESLRATIEDALGAEHAERARIASGITALLAGSPASPEETFFVVRRLLGALAHAKPVVLVIDDLHWAEPLLLDLVEHLIQWGSGVPLFVLIGARPELRDLRSSLVTPGGFVSDVVTLHGLDAGAAMRLAANVIGAADLPAAIAAKVLATSEGNPLFVGELVRMLVQEGALTKEGDRWIAAANLAALEMPPTIHALLAARIERLRPEERTVLERAAVVGRQFSRSAVAALLPREAGDLDARLEALRRSELIERDTGWLLGEPVLRFHHVLIRDAAYRRLLKGTRAELHATLADWVEAQVGDAPEHDETIGRHLEQAHQFLRELGPLDPNGKRLGERAAQRLAAAGRRALARDDLPVAADLLGRAIERLDGDDSARADLALDWCEALLAAGDVGPAAAAIDELGRFSADSDRLHAWHTCFAGQHQVLTAPSELRATAEAVAAAAAALTAQGDAAGEAKAHFVHALALSRLGQVGACEAALDRALAAARRAGDRRRANTVLAIAPLAALWGPSPVTRASGRCLDVVRVLRITQGAPAVEAVALSCQGVLEALRGRADAARRMIASARRMVEELGITQRLLEADVFGGLVELLEGDAPAAEPSLRGAYEGLRDLGLGIDAARAAALLARALLAQGRVAEAEMLSHESEALAGDDLKAAIAWRGVRAEALAKRGEHAAAVEFASKAVELAAATDALLDHADARLALAAALRSAGRDREADAEERRATELWQAKGATLLAQRTPRTDAPIEPVATEAPASAENARRARRAIRPNSATEEARRIEAAVAARDVQAMTAVYRRDVEIVDHLHGVTYGYEAIVERLRSMMEDATEAALVHEPLASFGDALGLLRLRTAASGSTEVPYVLVIEADERGCARRIEIFAEDKLDDAIARLYERHAELLPEGPERMRAEVTARSFAALEGSNANPERIAPALAPDLEGVDHRHLSSWSLRGADAYLAHARALHEVADDVVLRPLEILALAPNATLRRILHSGTDRAGGGAYERAFLSLFVAGADGRIARAEWFDDDHEAEALARFEALSAETGLRQPARARTNAASALVTRFEAAFANADPDELASCFSDSLAVLDHPTGASYGREGHLESLGRLARATHPRLAIDALGTIGDTLVLCRRRVDASGTAGDRYDVGAWERAEFVIFESDAAGRIARIEIFADDHLADAIARLYERHAERLPAGPAQQRAAATARAVAALLGPPDLDAWRACLAAGVEFDDHRILGFGSLRGREAGLPYLESLFETSECLSTRIDDVLALEPHAFLVRWTESGVAVGGGDFERVQLTLWILDGEGRVARLEYFDVDREAAALARFDALVGRDAELPEAPFANAASRVIDHGRRQWAARDWAGVVAVISPAMRMDDRRRIVRLEIGYEDFLAQFRMLFDQPGSRWRWALVATRGERLSLHRVIFETEVADGGGALAFDDHLSLAELDAEGRIVAFVTFDLEDEDAAWAELDARFAADPSEAHGRTTVAFDRAIARRDWDAVAALCSPAFVEHDHRGLAMLGTTHGAEAWMQNFRALVALAPDTIYRTLHARGAARGFLSVGTWQGSREGGRYEIPLIAVCEVDARGAIARADLYEPDQLGQVRARFDALAAPCAADPARRRVRANAATRSFERLTATLSARDRDALAQHFDESLVVVHHPSGASYGRREMVATWRGALKAERFGFHQELLASLGDTLALDRHLVSVEGLSEAHLAAFGHAEFDEVSLLEVDEHGRCLRCEIFAAERLGDALVRLYERYAEQQPEGPARARAEGVARAVASIPGPVDLDRMASAYAPDLRLADRRVFATWSSQSGAELVDHFRHQLALAPDFAGRVDEILGLEPHALLIRITFVGTSRDSGGAFENRCCVLYRFGDDGRMVQVDCYEAEDDSEAIARFHALRTEGDAAPADEPFANAASRADRRLFDCFHARDWAGIEALAAPDLVFDERRRMVRNTCGRDLWLEQFRVLFDVPQSRFTTKLRATRGERLSLNLHCFAGVVAGGGGPVAMEDHLVLHEIDRDGRFVAMVLFDLEDEDAAYAELDARWQAGEGAEQAPALAFLTSFDAALARRDWDAVTASYAPAFVGVDHRLVGWGTLHGPAAFVEAFRTLVALAPDVRLRWDHGRTSSRGMLAQAIWLGTRDGGAFENPFLMVGEFDDEGTILRADFYDVHHLDRAQARFQEIESAAPPPASPFANAASRANRSLGEASNARDFARIEALLAASLVFDDRRRLNRLTVGREEALAHYRFLQEVPRGRFSSTLLATRGERLALHRTHFEGEVAGGGGAVDVEEVLDLAEIDAEGRVVANLLFDLEDEDAAWAELDARFDAGEGLEHPAAAAWCSEFRRAFASREWDAMAALQAPDQEAHDHRLVGWGTLRGAGAWTPTLQELVTLAPDVRQRVQDLRLCARGSLWRHDWYGTRDGGAFVSSLVLVVELDGGGRQRRLDVWDADRLDAALARFQEIAAPAAPDGRFENAASRAWRAVNEAWSARDLERFAAPHAAALRYRDHRRLFELDLDRAGFLDFTRPLIEMRAGRASLELVATRGERLALMHSTMEMADDAIGPSVIESLMLIETDERGEIAAYDRWDLEDADAAWAEIEARWSAGDGALGFDLWATRFGAALERRDWDAVAAGYAADFVGHDHRLVSWGTVHGPSEHLRALREMVALAPDARMRMNHRLACARGALLDNTWVGTRDGGAFESPFVCVAEFGADGRTVRSDFYDPHHLDRALARFEEIRASERRDPLAAIAKPNAACATMDRWQATYDVAFETGDWEPMRALCAPDLVFDDRRRLALLSGDRDFMIASARERVAMDARPQRSLRGTAGDRVAIETILWSGGPPDGRFEIEYLGVIEVDESGLVAGMVMFDIDDARAAQREAWARWAAIDPAVAPHLALLSSAADAFNERDRSRVRAPYADDLIVEDHRRAGLGRLEGGDAYADSLAVLWELASVTTVELGWYWPAIAPDGALVTIRRTGDIAGGGPFESDYLYLFFHAQGRMTRVELFELEDLDAALARFEELRGSERREGLAASVRPNLATAAMERNWTAFDALDLDAADAALDAARAHYAPDFVWDDRRPLVGLSGGLDLMLASVRERLVMGARQQRTIVGTAGDRVAIGRALWAGGPPDGRFEVEFLVVSEVDEAGLFSALIFFEPGDTRAAQREAWSRWAAIDPAVAPVLDGILEITDAWNAHDRARLRACYAEGLVVEDHRLAGIGRIVGVDAYVETNAVLWDLAPDQRIGYGWSLPAVDRHGAVGILRREGRLPDGGAFESEYVTLSRRNGDLITHLEFFELVALDAALARFEELRPDPLRIPPNAATRSLAPVARLLASGDLDALRALVTDDFCFDDRTRRSLLRGGVEEWVRALEFLSRETRAQLDAGLVATAGDRLALYHDVWQEAPGESHFRMESHRLVEIDAAGKLRALVLFDANDRAMAHTELFERYAASGADGMPRGMIDYILGLNEHDLARARTGLCDDFVLEDHRRTGLGRIEGADAYIASVAAAYGLAPDLRVDPLYTAATAAHGRVALARASGTNTEGGAFESFYAVLVRYRDDQVAGYEFFEPEHLDQALARLEALRPARG